MILDLNEHAVNSGETFDPSRTGLDHLAFSASSYQALVAWVAHLEAKDVAHSPIRDIANVGQVFDCRDPDGIQLEFFHPDQGGTWVSYVQHKLAQSHPLCNVRPQETLVWPTPKVAHKGGETPRRVQASTRVRPRSGRSADMACRPY